MRPMLRTHAPVSRDLSRDSHFDKFLRLYHHFARYYINDIIIFFHIAKKHFQHSKTIFAFFARLKITLELKKSYLNYLSIILFK